MEVELCEGLEEIGRCAFYACKSLKRIKIPSTVKVIGADVFKNCDQLAEVELCGWIDDISMIAFRHFHIHSLSQSNASTLLKRNT